MFQICLVLEVSFTTKSSLPLEPTAAGFALSVMGLRWLAAPSYLLVHMVVTPLAGMFMFVCLIMLQTTLATLLPHRLLRGISIAAQLLFVIALIEMFVYSPAVSTWLASQALSHTTGILKEGQNIVRWPGKSGDNHILMSEDGDIEFKYTGSFTLDLNTGIFTADVVFVIVGGTGRFAGASGVV